jgi:predicted nucleic acid-binding Zn ribbon protein
VTRDQSRERRHGESGDRPAAGAVPEKPPGGRHGMERLGDLLPDAARELGLEDELELAAAISAWQQILRQRVPAAVGSSRLVGLAQGVATVEADQPIVAQELRLRAPELTAALRSAVRSPVRQLRIAARHV